MPEASPLASQVAKDVLTNADFLVSVMLKTRTSGAYNQYGEWEDGEETASAVKMAYAPGVRDRMALPEGLQDRELVTFYYHGTAESLRTGQSDGDVITMDGANYRAIQVNRWEAFTEIVASRQD